MNRHRGTSSPDYPNRSLFVRDIPPSTRPEDLRLVFDQFGRVNDVYIPRDYYTRKRRSFAYVEFERLRDAEKAMRHAGRIRLFGKDLDIEYAKGNRKTPTQMRTRPSRYESSSTRRRYERSPSRSRYRSPSRSRSPSPRSRSRRYASRSRSRSVSPSRRFYKSYSPSLKYDKQETYAQC